MTEVPDNTFEILASNRTRHELDVQGRELETDRLALDAIARRVGATSPVPDDVRVIVQHVRPGDTTPDTVEYPSPSRKDQAILGRPHDVYVRTPVVDERSITSGLARALRTHPKLSPYAARAEDDCQRRRDIASGVTVTGLSLVVSSLPVSYVYSEASPWMALGGTALFVGGAAVRVVQNLSGTVGDLFNPQGHPYIDDLPSPIRLVEQLPEPQPVRRREGKNSDRVGIGRTLIAGAKWVVRNRGLVRHLSR